MEIVLESKRNEPTIVDKLNSFYALYSLKVNRSNKQLSNSTSQNLTDAIQSSKPTVAQFLDKEATANRDFSLSLISNSIPSENETFLKENLARKVEKGTFYASNNGYISAFNLNFKQDEEAHESICYYCLYRQKEINQDEQGENPLTSSSNEYIICFILDDSKYNLDLFRNELDFYFENYLQVYFRESDAKEIASNENLQDLLANWYDYSINYITRSLKLLNKNELSILINEAFTCGHLDLNNLDEKTSRDMKILFKSFNSSYLFLTSSTSDNSKWQNVKTTKTSTTNSVDEASKLVITFDQETKKFTFSKTEISQFSDKCSSHLLDKASFSNENDPFRDKQEIENNKLQLAQELNTFNRYLRKAQNHYYDLYKFYLYLKHSPISQTLIQMHENSLGEISPELVKVFNVVIEFYYKQQELELNIK